MARPRKIETDRAVPVSMEVFWRYGFHQVGTRQLEDETGVTRFALQTIHGGKKSIYLQGLDHYLTMFEDCLLPQMDDGSLETLARWFVQLGSREQVGDNFGSGCLMVNGLVEFAGTDPEVGQRVDRFMTLLSAKFASTLGNIQLAGGLSEGFDIGAAGALLVAAAIGLNVSNRATRGEAAGGPLALGIAAMVRGWARNVTA
jgi:TetR/AcrR family transcriptional regulator, transcriptional repressor for nem operon